MQDMEEIYREHLQTVYKYLLALTRDEQLSEELAQETFYQAVRSADRFDGSCKVSTWLCAIAKRLLLAYRRKHPPAEELSDELSVPSAESEAVGENGRLELFMKLHGQDETAKEVMYLRALGGLSFSQIGAVMGRTENWARVTYYRTKEKLKKELENNE